MTVVTASLVFLLCVFIAYTQARSSGAPDAACAAIAPQHTGVTSQPLASSPFSLNVSSLTATGGYTPGKTYTLVLTGTQQYTGLLVQARQSGTTNPVGSFVTGTNVRTACSGSAVTHTSSVLKNNVELTWTAPPIGTGSITFSYAVVVQFNTYYATLTSQSISQGNVTNMPTTEMPGSSMPTTKTPVPSMPTTNTPVTNMPTTEMPGSSMPTTKMPVPSMPTTEMAGSVAELQGSVLIVLLVGAILAAF